MNPEVFACFSRFSHFLNFGWFCDGFILNFDSAAKFPARGWSQIARALNFHSKWHFSKDVTGRNKKYQKYQLWACKVFIIPPSSRALALHALIISLEFSGKIVKLQNELANFSHSVKFRSKITKMSFNFDLKTSCALPPYFSLELNRISSKSHYQKYQILYRAVWTA